MLQWISLSSTSTAHSSKVDIIAWKRTRGSQSMDTKFTGLLNSRAPGRDAKFEKKSPIIVSMTYT